MCNSSFFTLIACRSYTSPKFIVEKKELKFAPLPSIVNLAVAPLLNCRSKSVKASQCYDIAAFREAAANGAWCLLLFCALSIN